MSSDIEGYFEVESDGENVDPEALSELLHLFAEALEDAPSRKLYDFDLTVEEKTISEAADAEEAENSSQGGK